MVRTYNNIYCKIINIENLIIAYKKARKVKTKKNYVIEFEKNLMINLLKLREELLNQTYKPQPLVIFILRDPKTRKISKSAFRDRIVHHAIVNVLEPIFDRAFIYDSCANRKGKGNLFALKRFYEFIREVSRNGKINGWFNKNQIKGYCFKADIKHYFQEVNHDILINIIKRKINDERIIWLIWQILKNYQEKDNNKGMPLGNLTSQFFANIYLNELDYFVKHELKVKYYIRYVDDFVILHSSKMELKIWKQKIDKFLRDKLKLELHFQKSKIISLSKGIDFVGFRNFYYFRLLRRRNIRKMLVKIQNYKKGDIPKEKILEIFQGWNAYAKLANSLGVRREVVRKIYSQNQ
ncbi:MAG: reverse transcriptase domain-containing protein [Nanoarchaeota archaeon]